MKKETILSILRSLLVFVGSILIGHHFMSQVIDQPLWDAIGGAIFSVSGMVWGIFDKTTGLEQFEAVIKQLLVFIGGILVAAGKLSAEALNTYLGIVMLILPTLWSKVSKDKVVAAEVATASGAPVKPIT